MLKNVKVEFTICIHPAALREINLYYNLIQILLKTRSDVCL